jgi:DNA-binding transcriptional regulator YiaG
MAYQRMMSDAHVMGNGMMRRAAPAATYSISTQIPTTSHVNPHAGYEENMGQLVQDLKEATGLTWSQFADLFGVSRRAVHFWVSGGNISADHIALFESIRARVSRLGKMTAAETRSALFTLGENGMSLYATLIGETSRLARASDSRPLGTADLESNVGNPGILVGSETVDGIERNRY